MAKGRTIKRRRKAKAPNVLADIPDTLTTGVKNTVAPVALAGVGGLASSRLIERTIYQSFEGTFGVNTGEGSLTEQQQAYRTVTKGATAVLAGGLMVPSRNRIVRAAGVGLMLGSLWHVLNDFGINV